MRGNFDEERHIGDGETRASRIETFTTSFHDVARSLESVRAATACAGLFDVGAVAAVAERRVLQIALLSPSRIEGEEGPVRLVGACGAGEGKHR